jgi:RNA polymerase sigma-70 factor (ECF subfamily)
VTVEALRRGDPAVLEELLGRYGREIQTVAYLILRDRADAEDVLADTLLKALDRASSLRDPDALRPWLLRMATNLSLSRRRRGARLTVLEVAGDAPVPVGPDATDRLALLDGIAALPLRTRAAVVLHYYADLSVADVATTMGTSPNPVKTQLRQALERLRVALGERPATAGVPAVEVARG